MLTSSKVLIVLLLLASLDAETHAQQGAISGIVMNNGQPVAGVLIGAQIKTYSSSSFDPLPSITTARSDKDGAFRLTGLEPDTYLLMPLSPGWARD